MDIEPLAVGEVIFRHEMNRSKMATDLLAAGIRKFEEDGNKLKKMIEEAVIEHFKKDEKNEEGEKKDEKEKEAG